MPVFNAYVDGFNLYMGALKGHPELKWLDLVAFCKAARPDMELGKIYFFTASISEKFPGDDAPRRQEKYLRVLSHQGIEVVRGKFQKNRKWSPLASSKRREIIEPTLPSFGGVTQLALSYSARAAKPEAPKARVVELKEKGSDVNLASYLLQDAFSKAMDAALVITADSDLVTPVIFASNVGVNVKVVSPHPSHRCDELRAASNEFSRVACWDLSLFQLSKTYVSPKGRQITRPSEWN